MILDTIKQYIQSSDVTVLEKISKNEVLQEIELSLRSIPVEELNLNEYQAIIGDIVEIFLDEEEKSFPFAEKAYLISTYMMARGVDTAYFQYLFSVCSAAEIVLKLEPMVREEETYRVLEREYDRYVSRSVSIIIQKLQAMNSKGANDVQELEEAVEKIQELIDSRTNKKGKVDKKKMN